MNAIASLPWYDLPSTHHSVDQFWQTLASNLRDAGFEQVPSRLDRSTPVTQQWCKPELLISQCCGPDLFTASAAQLRVIARAVFSDLDCTAGYYFSHIVQSTHYNHGPARLIVNSVSSRSGHGALLEWCEQSGISVQSISVSGSHQASMQALREHRADLAAIDAHSWNLLNATDLEIIGRSTEALSPPYVTRLSNRDVEVLRQALARTVNTAGHLVGIQSIIATDKTAYNATRIEQSYAHTKESAQSPPIAHSNQRTSPPNRDPSTHLNADRAAIQPQT